MNYQYSQEAKERLIALGPVAIAGFIDEIPPASRISTYKLLPKVQGFRTGSEAERKEKQKRLINHLTNPHASPKEAVDWKTFAYLWTIWAREKLGPKFPAADNPDTDFDNGVTWLNDLARLIPDAAREDVERLFLFSSFPETAEIVASFTKFRPASVIARDRMIDGLPARLKSIESRVKLVDSVSVDLMSRFEKLEITAASHTESFDPAESEAFSELRAALDFESKRADTTEEIIEELSATGAKLFELNAAAVSRMGAIELSVGVFEKRAETWDELVFQSNKLSADVAEVLAHQTTLGESAQAYAALAKRVEQLEIAILNKHDSAPAPAPVSQQRVRLLKKTPEGQVHTFSTAEGVCKLIASNFQAAGIKKGASIAIARQVIAALVAGQMVQFSGSLADFMAEAVANAISGPAYHEWQVPVGLLSNDAAWDCIEIVAGSSNCLLLKGANLSAFEIYGAAIRDIIVRRQFPNGDHGRLALIASWAQGPAAFPNGGMLAELGPVFETDTLPMRGISAVLPNCTLGHFAGGDWSKIEGLNTDESGLVPEILGETLKEAAFEGGSLWRRTTNRAYTILRTIPNGTPEEDLHNLLISWVVPWARANGGPAGSIMQLAERELRERQMDTTV